MTEGQPQAGLVCAGVSIPRLRLDLKTAPFRDQEVHELSLNSPDEDVVTMAAEAARNAMLIAGTAAGSVTSVHFASQTLGSRALVSQLTDILSLRGDTHFFVHSGSSLASPEALQGAASRVASGESGTALVIASETGAWPGNAGEASGSAAVAFVMTASGQARLADSSSFRADRTQRQSPSHGEERVARMYGYEECLAESTKKLIERDKSAHKLILPGGKSERSKLSKRLGLPAQEPADGGLRARTGCRGSLDPLMGMVEALSSEVSPSLVVGFYGPGEGSVSLRVQSSERLKVAGLEGLSHGKAVAFQDYLLLAEKRRSLSADSALYTLNLPSLMRSSRRRLSLVGWKCTKCGRVATRQTRACTACRSPAMQEVELPRKGKVYTYSTVDIAPEGFEPYAPYPIAVVELDSGQRIQCQLTDCGVEEIKVGMEVEGVVRILYASEGLVSYDMKFRPAYR